MNSKSFQSRNIGRKVDGGSIDKHSSSKQDPSSKGQPSALSDSYYESGSESESGESESSIIDSYGKSIKANQFNISIDIAEQTNQGRLKKYQQSAKEKKNQSKQPTPNSMLSNKSGMSIVQRILRSMQSSFSKDPVQNGERNQIMYDEEYKYDRSRSTPKKKRESSQVSRNQQAQLSSPASPKIEQNSVIHKAEISLRSPPQNASTLSRNINPRSNIEDSKSPSQSNDGELQKKKETKKGITLQNIQKIKQQKQWEAPLITRIRESSLSIKEGSGFQSQEIQEVQNMPQITLTSEQSRPQAAQEFEYEKSQVDDFEIEQNQPSFMDTEVVTTNQAPLIDLQPAKRDEKDVKRMSIIQEETERDLGNSSIAGNQFLREKLQREKIRAKLSLMKQMQTRYKENPTIQRLVLETQKENSLKPPIQDFSFTEPLNKEIQINLLEKRDQKGANIQIPINKPLSLTLQNKSQSNNKMDKSENHQNSPPFLSDQKKQHKILPSVDLLQNASPNQDKVPVQISVNMQPEAISQNQLVIRSDNAHKQNASSDLIRSTNQFNGHLNLTPKELLIGQQEEGQDATQISHRDQHDVEKRLTVRGLIDRTLQRKKITSGVSRTSLNTYRGEVAAKESQPEPSKLLILRLIGKIKAQNSKAMTFMQQGYQKQALEILVKTEVDCDRLVQGWTENVQSLGNMASNGDACRALTSTFNNLGVIYKQNLKYNLSIKYLKKVLQIESEMEGHPLRDRDMAQSFINICSVYSEMGKHEIALNYVLSAVQILEKEYQKRYPNEMGSPIERSKFASIVATAFHNAAVEYEHTEDPSNGILFYSKAVNVCKVNLGPEHPLTQAFEKNFEGAKSKYNTRPNRHMGGVGGALKTGKQFSGVPPRHSSRLRSSLHPSESQKRQKLRSRMTISSSSPTSQGANSILTGLASKNLLPKAKKTFVVNQSTKMGPIGSFQRGGRNPATATSSKSGRSHGMSLGQGSPVNFINNLHAQNGLDYAADVNTGDEMKKQRPVDLLTESSAGVSASVNRVLTSRPPQLQELQIQRKNGESNRTRQAKNMKASKAYSYLQNQRFQNKRQSSSKPRASIQSALTKQQLITTPSQQQKQVPGQFETVIWQNRDEQQQSSSKSLQKSQIPLDTNAEEDSYEQVALNTTNEWLETANAMLKLSEKEAQTRSNRNIDRQYNSGSDASSNVEKSIEKIRQFGALKALQKRSHTNLNRHDLSRQPDSFLENQSNNNLQPIKKNHQQFQQQSHQVLPSNQQHIQLEQQPYDSGSMHSLQHPKNYTSVRDIIQSSRQEVQGQAIDSSDLNSDLQIEDQSFMMMNRYNSVNNEYGRRKEKKPIHITSQRLKQETPPNTRPYELNVHKYRKQAHSLRRLAPDQHYESMHMGSHRLATHQNHNSSLQTKRNLAAIPQLQKRKLPVVKQRVVDEKQHQLNQKVDQLFLEADKIIQKHFGDAPSVVLQPNANQISSTQQVNQFIGAEKSHDELDPNVEVDREAIKALEVVKTRYIKMYNKMRVKEAVEGLRTAAVSLVNKQIEDSSKEMPLKSADFLPKKLSFGMQQIQRTLEVEKEKEELQRALDEERKKQNNTKLKVQSSTKPTNKSPKKQFFSSQTQTKKVIQKEEVIKQDNPQNQQAQAPKSYFNKVIIPRKQNKDDKKVVPVPSKTNQKPQQIKQFQPQQAAAVMEDPYKEQVNVRQSNRTSLGSLVSSKQSSIADMQSRIKQMNSKSALQKSPPINDKYKKIQQSLQSRRESSNQQTQQSISVEPNITIEQKRASNISKQSVARQSNESDQKELANIYKQQTFGPNSIVPNQNLNGSPSQISKQSKHQRFDSILSTDQKQSISVLNTHRIPEKQPKARYKVQQAQNQQPPQLPIDNILKSNLVKSDVVSKEYGQSLKQATKQVIMESNAYQSAEETKKNAIERENSTKQQTLTDFEAMPGLSNLEISSHQMSSNKRLDLPNKRNRAQRALYENSWRVTNLEDSSEDNASDFYVNNLSRESSRLSHQQRQKLSQIAKT